MKTTTRTTNTEVTLLVKELNKLQLKVIRLKAQLKDKEQELATVKQSRDFWTNSYMKQEIEKNK